MIHGNEVTLSVAAIKSGTVIDHITAGSALKIISLLHLTEGSHRISVGLNLKSRSMNLKDLIKIEDFFLSPLLAGQVAVFSPQATINVIDNYKVAKKFQVQMPEAITTLLACPNPCCITWSESVQTLLSVEENHKTILLRCRHCEKHFPLSDLRATSDD